MFLAYPLLGLAHDFIRTPLSDPANTAFVSVTFSTPSSRRSLPRLPMLHLQVNHPFTHLNLTYWARAWPNLFKLINNSILIVQAVELIKKKSPDSMSRATLDVGDKQVPGAWTD